MWEDHSGCRLGNRLERGAWRQGGPEKGHSVQKSYEEFRKGAGKERRGSDFRVINMYTRWGRILASRGDVGKSTEKNSGMNVCQGPKLHAYTHTELKLLLHLCNVTNYFHRLCHNSSSHNSSSDRQLLQSLTLCRASDLAPYIYLFTDFIKPLYEIHVIIHCISHMRKPRHRDT